MLRNVRYLSHTLVLATILIAGTVPAFSAAIAPPLVGIPDLAEHGLFTTCLDCGNANSRIVSGGTDTWTFTVQNLGAVPWTDFHLNIIGLTGFDRAILEFDVPTQITGGFGAAPTINGSQRAGDPARWDFNAADVAAPVPPGGNASFTATVINRGGFAADYHLGLQPTAAPEPGSLMLLLSGLGALGLLCRHRRA